MNVRTVALAAAVLAVGWVVHVVSASPAGANAPSCNPISRRTCAMPYPSNVFTVTDPASPTGLRLDVDDAIVGDELLQQLDPVATPSALFGGKTGFSASGPILFEVDRPIDRETLPRDGGDALVVFDLDTGDRVPIVAEVDRQALAHDSPGHVVRAWPRSRFEFGHHYVAALTEALRDTAGDAYAPSDGFAAVLGGDDPDLVAYHAPFIEFLGEHGVDSQRLVSAIDFTVRAEAGATGPLVEMAATAYAQAHPVRKVRKLEAWLPDAGAIVVGELRLTDFRNEIGRLAYEPGAQGHDLWVDFILTIPQSAHYEPAPVAIYGHGISAFKETMLDRALPNLDRGIATIAIDMPNHGVRAQLEGGLLTELTSPEEVGQLFALVPQAAVDLVSVVKAIETSLADLDMVQAPFDFGRMLRAALRGHELRPTDGRPDLDTSEIVYQGTSMGGVLGTSFCAVAPRIDACTFQVGGVGIMHILTGSRVWYDLGLDEVLPAGGTAGEAAVSIAAVQMALDLGDGINFAHRFDDPYNSATAADDRRPALLVYGLGDAIVPNYGSERLAEIADLPLIEPIPRPRPHLATSRSLVEGDGAVQIRRSSGMPFEPWQFLAHISFLTQRSTNIQRVWLDTVLAG